MECIIVVSDAHSMFHVSYVIQFVPETTIHKKILAGEKLAKRELFVKIFLTNIHRKHIWHMN